MRPSRSILGWPRFALRRDGASECPGAAYVRGDDRAKSRPQESSSAAEPSREASACYVEFRLEFIFPFFRPVSTSLHLCLLSSRASETLTFLKPTPWVVMETFWCPLS